MAMDAPSVTVAIERAVHDGLRELIQALELAHGIRVNSVNVEWIDVSSLSEPRFVVRDMAITTTTAAAAKP